MVHPVLVHDAEHDHALHLAHEGRAAGHEPEGGLLLLIDVEGALEHLFRELVRREACGLLGREAQLARHEEEPAEGREDFVYLLYVRMRLGGEALGNRAGDVFLYHPADARLQILAVEHLPALGVYDVALHVHDVVVLEDVLSGLEVAALDRALGLLYAVGEQLLVEGRVLVYLQRLHEAGDALAAEEAQQIVRQREEETALARVALASGAAAQLVVYTPRLVPLRAEDKEAADGLDLLGLGVRYLLVLGHALGEQPARGEDFLAVRVRVARGLGDDLLGIPGLLEVVAREILRVAAEHDVRASAGHVRGDGDGAELAGLRDYLRLALMLLGVQDVVRDAALFQKAGEVFALLNAYRAHQHGLALLVAGDNLLYDGPVLARLVLIDDVGVVLADDGLVRGYLDDVEGVDGLELLGLGERGAGHAGELAVEAEVVLEGYRGQRAVFALDVDVLLGLYGLVQALGVPPAEHEAARELVDDNDLAVLDDVVYVPLHDAVGLEGLVYVVGEGGIFNVGEVVELEPALGLGRAARGERGGAGLLVDDVVGVQVLGLLGLVVRGGDDEPAQRADKVVRAAVHVRALVAAAGDDERRPRLVYEYGVDLVDDGEGVPALHHLALVYRHVVAQIVEAELVIRAVGDVGRVGRAALLAREAVDDKADGEAHEAVDLAHPLAVALGEVVVDGDDVDALARNRVEVRRQDGDEGLALAGLHLGDAALVEDDAAYELDAEGLHAQDAPGRLAHGGEGLGHQLVQALARGVALFELLRLGLELLVREGAHLRLKGLNPVDNRVYAFKLVVAVRAEKLAHESHNVSYLRLVKL